MAGIEIKLRARSLPERIVYGILALAVLVLGFFFLVAALIAGAILAAGVLARLWWLKRRLRKAADSEFLTTEYTVVERETRVLPPAGRDERR
jgi:membrane protein implicated in regulation of membrane protease activity